MTPETLQELNKAAEAVMYSHPLDGMDQVLNWVDDHKAEAEEISYIVEALQSLASHFIEPE